MSYLKNLYWLKQIEVRRQCNESCVVVVVTNDRKRLVQLLKSDFVLRKHREVFWYDTVMGLWRIKCDGGRIYREPHYIGSAQQQSPIASLISRQQGLPRVPFDAFVNWMISEIFTLANARGSEQFEGYSRCFVITNVPPSAREYFSMTINALATADEPYLARVTIVVVTDCIEKILDPSVVENCIVVDVEPSTEEERRKLITEISNFLAKKGLKAPSNEEIKVLIDITRGLNLHDLETVLLESFVLKKRFDTDFIVQAKASIFAKSEVIEFVQSKYGFEAVGGYDYLKEYIKNTVIEPWRNRELAMELGLELPRGILLFGIQGTGKTWFTKALARELGIPMFKLGEIRSRWYGETESRLRRAFKILRASAPCILFIDEVDQIATARGSPQEHEVDRRVKNMLLEELGDAERNYIIVCTTNRPEDLDPAFIRRGRIDIIVPVLHPDFEARKQILRVHTSVVRRVPLAEDVDLDLIAEKTMFFTGAELEALVKMATQEAFKERKRRVYMKHFEIALQNFHKDIGREVQTIQHYLELADRFSTDRRFIEQVRRVYERELSRVREVTEYSRLEVSP
ncbi:MAG: hypothetical protein DRJ40_11565 [Thermoprotei archaeon]|nr:MAG: hypothetical protein DRJ40_11565 [Thermoprotei archaeon]